VRRQVKKIISYQNHLEKVELNSSESNYKDKYIYNLYLGLQWENIDKLQKLANVELWD